MGYDEGRMQNTGVGFQTSELSPSVSHRPGTLQGTQWRKTEGESLSSRHFLPSPASEVAPKAIFFFSERDGAVQFIQGGGDKHRKLDLGGW